MKKNVLKVLLLVCFQMSAQIDLTENLLVHYIFDGNANDSSGNNYHGVASGVNYTEDRNMMMNASVSFDGIDDFIDLPNIAMLKPSLPVSIALWAKFDNLQDVESVMFTTDFDQNNHSGIWSSLASGKIAVSYGDATGNTTSGNRRSKIGTTLISSGQWYHFVFIIRGETDMDIYINSVNDNGVYSGSSNNGIGYTSEAGSLGRKDSHTSFPAYHFKGALDDFRYWNKALSTEEIAELYNSEILSIETGYSNLEDEILIYPNPVKDYLTIKTEKEVVGFSMYSMRGSLVKNGNKISEKLDVSNLPRGIYLLNILTKKGLHNYRVVLD